MGSHVTPNKWNTSTATETLRLAHQRARQIEQKIREGFFDSSKKTIGIEQESFVVEKESFSPCDLSLFVEHNSVGVRPETACYCVEYDLSPVLEATPSYLQELPAIVQAREREVEEAIQKQFPDAFLINNGTHPLLQANEWQQTVLQGKMKARYNLLEEASVRENTHPIMKIENEETGEIFIDKATNLAANTRCFATQLHFGFPSFEETLRAYNASVAFTGILMAIYANSPFIGGVDSGLGSARIEALSQSEQKRYRQARYATSYEEHVRQELVNIPPFTSFSEEEALRFCYSAEHITTRICLDEEKRTSRIEVRGLDAIYARDVTDAVVFFLCLFEGVKDEQLPTQEEVDVNFQQGKRGTKGEFIWNHTGYSYEAMVKILDTIAKKGAEKLGLPYTTICGKINTAEQVRKIEREYESQGMKKQEAIKQAIKQMKFYAQG